MPSYLDLVYSGSYLARFSNRDEVWRLGETLYVVNPVIDIAIPMRDSTAEFLLSLPW